jgi:hypothetical protein
MKKHVEGRDLKDYLMTFNGPGLHWPLLRINHLSRYNEVRCHDGRDYIQMGFALLMSHLIGY